MSCVFHDPAPGGCAFPCHGFSGRRILCEWGFWWYVDPPVSRIIPLDPLLVSTGWRVENLARELNLGRRTLARVIENSIGIPPKQWMRTHRAITARHLLREGRMVGVVAGRCGFLDHSAFSREFKSVMGVTPERCREIELSRSFAPPDMETPRIMDNL